MTKIILVRHGHVEGISPERFRGRTDLMLTPEGLRQAEATARRIHATWRPAAVYTSPLGRCRMTAEAIGNLFGLSPSPVDGLIDIDYGQWQGLTPDEIEAPMAQSAGQLVPDPGLGGDPGRRNIAESALPDGQFAPRGDRPASVRYGGAGRARQRQPCDLAARAGAPSFPLLAARARPCAINEIDFSEDGFTVLSMNETYHLQQ